jgi:hypothetical protein
MSLASCSNFGEHVPLNLLMPNKNQNWKLCHFLGVDFAMEIAKTDNYINIFADILDWDIISSRYLSGPVIIKFKDKINWRIFLRNEQPKDIECLYQVYDKIRENSDLFFNVRMKRRYYNTYFIHKFHDIVDWNWVAKNIKVEEKTLITYWHKFPKQYISKYQHITPKIIKEYADDINWTVVSKKNVRDILYTARNYLKWDIICKKNIPDYILCNYEKYLHWDNVAKYQSLSEWFIIKYVHNLNMMTICETQNLSYNFLQTYKNKLYFNKLIKNKHYNKTGCIKILLIDNQYFIINPAEGKVLFY